MTNPIFENLNEAQAEAVNHVNGPLLVVAGAGTGKTRVITAKILHLIVNKNVPPSSILALTFTEKASEEMKTRVDEALPYGYEEIAIKTFHSFCDSVLRESGHEIGIDSGYRLLDQASQWLFLKKHIHLLELDYYRPPHNPGKFIVNLIEHFSRLKDEDISPEAYVAFAAKKTKEAVDKADIESAKKMSEAANAYAKYQELMAKENQLDFGDLIYYALKLFKTRVSVLREYSNRFRYIMVDEFQDTNLAQNRIVNLLAKDHRNITVVGDDDQSIYKWRGASLSNILTFRRVFPDAKACVLNKNYRSSQKILDLSYALIRKNDPFRLEASENLSKKLVALGDGEPVEIHHFESYLDEAKAIAAFIAQKVAEGKVTYKDCAILVRTNNIAGSFAEQLKEAGIPYSMRDNKGLFSYEEIKDLIALIRFILKPHDDVAYFRLLSLPVFGLKMSDLLEIIKRAKEADYENLFFYIKKSVSAMNMNRVAFLPGMANGDDPIEAVKATQELFEYLLDFSRNHSVNRLLGEFLDKSGYYRAITSKMDAVNAEKALHIAQFLQIATDFNITGREGLLSFLEYIESMDQVNVPTQIGVTPDADAVAILTVHSAKGLEFEYVFVPSLVGQRFPAVKRKDAIEIPFELVSEDLPHNDMHLHEERRLFYVACTRAKSKLFLSYSDFYEGSKKWKVSPFIKEIEANGVAIIKKEIGQASSESNNVKEQPILLSNNRNAQDNLSYIPAVDLNLLSYSRVDTFKSCPLKYKFRYLFKIASPTSHAANFGSSLHNTINMFYSAVIDGASPSFELLKDLYDKCWISRGYDSKAHEQARKRQGLAVLESFYQNEEKNGFIKPAFLEKSFNVKIDKLRFSGRIDRIDRLADGTYEVIDYKTGSYKKDADVDKDLQLSLYALACRDALKLNVSKLSLYFLESAQKISTKRTEKDLEDLKQELIGISERMMVSDFAPAPGRHCQWCEYRILCNAAR